ncbi:MAG: twitching motility protein, partial [Betaproteobacteria bacterium]|nr:twitching motility protein [Betaproteobacteria bacterium]
VTIEEPIEFVHPNKNSVITQREDFLLHSMREFAANRATGRDTVMAATLYGLDDGDLVALAHYLSRIGP